MQTLPVVLLVIVGLAAVAGCVSQEQGPVGGTPAPAIAAPATLPQDTPAGQGTSPPVAGPTSPVPGALPGPLVLTPPGPYHAGDQIGISAHTILSPGNPVFIEVVSAGFNPTGKTNDTRFYGTSALVYVEKGAIDSDNSWSYHLDTTGYGPGLYQVQVSGLLVKNYQLSSSFTLLP